MRTDALASGPPAPATTAATSATKFDERGATPAPRPLRLWPAVLMLALFWVFNLVNQMLSMSGGIRFVLRMAAIGLLLIAFSTWWLSRRALSWRERLLVPAVFLLGAAAALAIADPSINAGSMLLVALPLIFTAGTVWLLLCQFKHFAPRARRVGLSAVVLLVLSVFTLIRFEGLDGAQHGEYNWRWRPTSEQLFLARLGTPAANEATPAPAAWTLRSGDVPGFRGAGRASVASGANLALDWSTQLPRQIWRQRIGPAWSSLIVVDGHVVTQEQREQSEVVACYDAATGKEVWVHADPVRFEESLSGAGPRGTPEFAGGRIFTLGGKGHLNCLDAATGELVWSHDLVAEAGATVPQWGFAVSPLVVDDKVIVFAPGKDAAGLIAYDAVTGELKWKLPGGGDTYSSPQLVELAGTRQLLMHGGKSLQAVNPEDGRLLWEIANGSEMAIPMLQPGAVDADKLLVLGAEGLSLLAVKQQDGKWSTEELWISNRLRPNFNDFVTHEGRIYGLDDGILCALDLETGERLWKKGRYGHGQLLLLADRDALVVLGARGEMTLVGIGGAQPEVLGAFEAIEGKTWNHPALVANRLYLRNGEEIACYELPMEN